MTNAFSDYKLVAKPEKVDGVSVYMVMDFNDRYTTYKIFRDSDGKIKFRCPKLHRPCKQLISYCADLLKRIEQGENSLSWSDYAERKRETMGVYAENYLKILMNTENKVGF